MSGEFKKHPLLEKLQRFFNPNLGLTAPAIDYSVPPSFAAKLPWVEIDDKGVTTLEDGRSVGAFFTITPVVSEDKHQESLERLLGSLNNAFATAAKTGADDDTPWVFQLYCRDIDNLTDIMPKLRQVVKIDDEFTQAVLAEDERHYNLIGREQGIFSSHGRAWRGRCRQVMLCVYRWLPPNSTEAQIIKNSGQLDSLRRYLLSPDALSGAGVGIKPASAQLVHDFLAPFFNPTQPRELLDFRKPRSSIDQDFSERLLASSIEADTVNGLWWFGNERTGRKACTVLELNNWQSDNLLTGVLFGEVKAEADKDRQKSVLFDNLPAGSLFAMTLLPASNKQGEARVKEIRGSAVGGEQDTVAVREQCDQIALDMRTHSLWRGQIALYLQATSVPELEMQIDTVQGALSTQALGARFVDRGVQVAPLDAYFRWLPMNYQPAHDSKYWYCGWLWLEDMLRLSPLFGRSTGTDSPALSFFNRGGEVCSFDPLKDYLSNAHLTLFGPSGSGKSATMVGICLRLLALHRPRLFIIEAGDSFGLLAEFCQRHGLTVNKVSLKPGSNVTLAPFADAIHLAGSEAPKVTSDEALKPEHLNDNDNPDDETRDILGELEIMARLMITGGEQRELDDYRRADSAMVRQAIIKAANTCKSAGVMVRPDHIHEALLSFSKDPELTAKRRERAETMAESMDLFREGMEGHIFNSEGQDWPEADVTIIDLGIYAKTGYEAQMATAYISLINRINAIAERDQFTGRHIVCLTDEAHLISTNLLLAPYATKIVKMWRKLNAWFWLATQDLADFPDVARKMLNNAEWWVLLNMGEDEIKTLQRFKMLSEDKLDLIRSMTAEDLKYKEGVVMGMDNKFISRFTVIPPALYLALGETDGDSKYIRKQFMDKHQVSELDAALMKAEDIYQRRLNYQGDKL